MSNRVEHVMDEVAEILLIEELRLYDLLDQLPEGVPIFRSQRFRSYGDPIGHALGDGSGERLNALDHSFEGQSILFALPLAQAITIGEVRFGFDVTVVIEREVVSFAIGLAGSEHVAEAEALIPVVENRSATLPRSTPVCGCWDAAPAARKAATPIAWAQSNKMNLLTAVGGEGAL